MKTQQKGGENTELRPSRPQQTRSHGNSHLDKLRFPPGVVRKTHEGSKGKSALALRKVNKMSSSFASPK